MAKAKDANKVPAGVSFVRRFAWNVEDEVDGIWVDVEGGARLKIARWGNPKHIELERTLRESKRAIYEGDDEAAKEAADKEVTTEVIGKAILRDWENVVDVDGNVIAYTPELGTEYSRDMVEFSNLVVNNALNAAAYRRFKEEDAVKNS